MQSPASQLLADLRDALASRDLRWYVFGAQAVVVHGRPRLTEDVDVTVELGDLARADFIGALRGAGFEPLEFVDDEFIEATRVIPFEHAVSGMALDVVIAGPGLEELFLAGAELTDLGGVLVPVICVDHLLVTKVLAGRPKDLEDARDILESNDSVNIDTVRALLSELESALDQSDLLAALERLLA